ncbi:5174_t:CDS:2, partial [Dentiscutata erythropus]
GVTQNTSEELKNNEDIIVKTSVNDYTTQEHNFIVNQSICEEPEKNLEDLTSKNKTNSDTTDSQLSDLLQKNSQKANRVKTENESQKDQEKAEASIKEATNESKTNNNKCSKNKNYIKPKEHSHDKKNNNKEQNTCNIRQTRSSKIINNISDNENNE